MAWLMASARCAAQGATSADEASHILGEVQGLVRRYGVNPKFISHRQFNAFPEDEEALGQRGVPPQLPEGYEDLLTQPAGPTLDVRMKRFESIALEAFRKWYANRTEAPDDLIHVTCSGYVAPSPAQRVLSEQGWYGTGVTHSYHMGCYGAFP